MTRAPTIPQATNARYACEPARRADDRAIRALLQQAMPGAVSFAMTHGPNHHAAVNLASERVDEVVVRDRAGQAPRVVGYGYRAVRRLYLNGSPAPVGYLGGLRCDRALRAAFRVLSRAFDSLAERRRPGELPYDLTSIMADNHVIRRALEKGLPGLPIYTPVGEMATLTIRARRFGKLGPRTRRASHQDHAAIQTLLDATGRCYHGRHAWQVTPAARHASTDSPTPGDFLLHEGGTEIPGCLALWDQRQLRQVVIAGLSPALRRARHAINLAAWATGRPGLPGPGSALDMAYASHAGFDLDAGDTARTLIAGACARAAERGIQLLSIGLPADAPILPYLIRRLKPWVSRSIIYAVSHQAQAVALDDRPVWMELATL